MKKSRSYADLLSLIPTASAEAGSSPGLECTRSRSCNSLHALRLCGYTYGEDYCGAQRSEEDQEQYNTAAGNRTCSRRTWPLPPLPTRVASALSLTKVCAIIFGRLRGRRGVAALISSL